MYSEDTIQHLYRQSRKSECPTILNEAIQVLEDAKSTDDLISYGKKAIGNEVLVFECVLRLVKLTGAKLMLKLIMIELKM